jgi:hypothetical protein
MLSSLMQQRISALVPGVTVAVIYCRWMLTGRCLGGAAALEPAAAAAAALSIHQIQ